MKRFTIILFAILTVMLSFSKPEYCNFRNHFKIDNALLTQKNLLAVNDTIILYRHWIYTNGENGYGKAILKTENNLSIKEFNLDSNRKLNSSDWKFDDNLKEVYKMLNKCLTKTDTNYFKPLTSMSHDGEHAIEVYTGNKLIYNFCINDLWLYPNRFNNNIKLIYLLRDKEIAESNGSKITFLFTTEGREKPLHNPIINSDTTIEHKRFYYIQKRFFKKTLYMNGLITNG